MSVCAVVFSKDRAMQVDAAIRSFDRHALNSAFVKHFVLYTTSNDKHSRQYDDAIASHPNWRFVRQGESFQKDLLSIVSGHEYVLFLVDDTLFVSDFDLDTAVLALSLRKDAIGFSLRLGKNTTYMYNIGESENVPRMSSMGCGVHSYSWIAASDGSFGYPIEVSSSLYRTEDLRKALDGQFSNPNYLEVALHLHRGSLMASKPMLLCFGQSVAFSAPMNKVQADHDNRSSSDVASYSPEALASKFDEGLRIDVSKFDGMIPTGVHQEVEFSFTRQPWMDPMLRTPEVGVLQLYLDDIERAAIRTIVDLGSRDCIEAVAMAKMMPNARRTIAVECNPDAIPLCEKTIRDSGVNIELVAKAICGHTGTCKFYPIDPARTVTPWIDGNIGASSLYKANGAYPFERYEQNEIEVPCTRLEDMCAELGVHEIDLLWMDLQGAELVALKSASELLRRIKYIHSEVSYIPAYEGQCLFDELDEYLRGYGFMARTPISRCGWQDNVLWSRQNA